MRWLLLLVLIFISKGTHDQGGIRLLLIVTAVVKAMIHIMLNTNGLVLDQRIHGMNIQMPTSELEGSTSTESVDQGSPGILLV